MDKWLLSSDHISFRDVIFIRCISAYFLGRIALMVQTYYQTLKLLSC